MSTVFVSSVKRDEGEEKLKEIIKDVLIKSTNDLAFLKEGDLVLLKPSLNSPGAYPATTHPLALKAVAEVLKERGAKVVAGDQSGIEYVVHTPEGVKKGSTYDNYVSSGMQKSDVLFKSFEEGDWKKDFIHYNTDKNISWPNGFYISHWIEKADHIINLPRISTHVMTGVTLGLKNMVGLLREDSRLEFHAEGPYSGFTAKYGGKHGLKVDYKDTGNFIEKIVEISLALQEKLRATLFVATEAQTTFGPDKKILGFLSSHVVRPQEGLVFASDDQVAVDIMALSFLTFLYRKKTPVYKKIFEKILLLQSAKNHQLNKQNPKDSLFIKHALGIGLGRGDFEINWINISDELKSELDNLIKT